MQAVRPKRDDRSLTDSSEEQAPKQGLPDFLSLRPAWYVRYGGVIAADAIATALTHAVGSTLDRAVFLLFWPVIVGAAWVGGIGEGLVASVLAVLAVDYFIIPPLHSIGPFASMEVLPLVAFLLVTLAISFLVSHVRRTHDSVQQLATKNADYAEQLREQSRELADQLEESQSLTEELEQSAEELAVLSEAADTAERFSRSIVQSITDPFVVLDADWRFQFINEAAERIFARSGHAQMIGRNVWESYPQLVGTPFEINMRRAADLGVPVSFDAYYEDTGEWAATHCYPLPEGGIASQWRNITERKRAEEAAHYLNLATTTLASSLDYEETLSRLAAVLVPQLGDWCAVHLVENEALKQVAVAHVDPAKIEFAREINERYPTPDDAPTGVPNVIRTGQPELYSDITDEMLTGGARDEEHPRIMRALSIRSVIIAPLSTDQHVIGAITLVGAESGRRYRDADLPLIMEIARRAAMAVQNARHHRDAVENRKRAEELQHVAEAANEAKTKFLTSMSHELRTPLNAIAGYADLMSLGIHGTVTDAQLEDLERIKRNQRHLLGIINDILNFARLDAGKVSYDISNINLYDVIDDLSPMIRPQVAGRDLRLSIAEISHDLTITADREKLRQVLLNLLSNAIKFTQPGGSIELSCAATPNTVRIFVKDTGIGIPADKLSSIFEPFVQVDRSLAQPVEGTGLGLAISRDMLSGMNGSLDVESTPGVGSTFCVTLPRAH